MLLNMHHTRLVRFGFLLDAEANIDSIIDFALL